MGLEIKLAETDKGGKRTRYHRRMIRRGILHAKIVEVEIVGVAIYRLLGEFRRANSYCHLYGAQGLGQRQAYF
ncbi:hypothetical protein TNCV_2334851 [Trichonephila clavipes]|uniref:Uncharacterized protein n=1 Tax=Trichonephila clavipes TaxID=2585209 RepID=A0A8X6SRP1_TRICX|nr:hypothetical protein TNCV_2334851 [Trichonephila clavipes]